MVVLPSSTNKTIIYLDTKYTEFQVSGNSNIEEAEKSADEILAREEQVKSLLEDHEEYCVLCKTVRLQGHGWRSRNAVGVEGEMTLLIHRMICPSCGQTYTLIPKGLHPYLVYTIGLIFLVIMAYLTTVKDEEDWRPRPHMVHDVCPEVNLDVRRQWVRNYVSRYKIMNTTTILPVCCEMTPYMAAPEHVFVTGDRERIIALRKQIPRPHHLHLIILQW